MRRFFGGMDCHGAVMIGSRTMYAGLALVPLSIAFGAWANQPVILYVLGPLGLVLFVAGWLLILTRAVCPVCGRYLGTNFPRAIGTVPNCCPHCGKRL